VNRKCPPRNTMSQTDRRQYMPIDIIHMHVQLTRNLIKSDYLLKLILNQAAHFLILIIMIDCRFCFLPLVHAYYFLLSFPAVMLLCDKKGIWPVKSSAITVPKNLFLCTCLTHTEGLVEQKLCVLACYLSRAFYNVESVCIFFVF